MRPRMTGGQKAIALLISPIALITLVGWGALVTCSVDSLAPEITGQRWFNTAPIRLAELKGR